MAQVTIPWESGGGSITASFNGEGTGRLDLSATANADEQGNERTVTIATTSGGVERMATVRVMQMGTRLPRRVIYVYDTASENPVEGVKLTVNGEEMTTDAAGEVTLSTVERLTVKLGEETYEYPSTVRDSLYGLAYSSMEYRVKVAVRCSTFNAACIGEDVATITMNGETKSTLGGETHGEAIFTGLEPGVTYPVTVECSGQTYESEVTVDPGVPDKVHKVVVDRWFERYRPTPNGRFQMAIRFTGSATSKSVTMSVSVPSKGNKTDTIYWGDGSTTTITGGVSTYNHTYSGEIDVWQVYNIEVTTANLTSNPIVYPQGADISTFDGVKGVATAFYNPGGSTNTFRLSAKSIWYNGGLTNLVSNAAYFDASFIPLMNQYTEWRFCYMGYLVGLPDGDYSGLFLKVYNQFVCCYNLVRVPANFMEGTVGTGQFYDQNNAWAMHSAFKGTSIQEVPDWSYAGLAFNDDTYPADMHDLCYTDCFPLKRLPKGMFNGVQIQISRMDGAFKGASTCETFDYEVFPDLPEGYALTSYANMFDNLPNLRRAHVPKFLKREGNMFGSTRLEELLFHTGYQVGETSWLNVLKADGIAYVPDEYLDDYRAGWPDFPAERVRPMSQLPPFVEKLALENAPVD